MLVCLQVERCLENGYIWVQFVEGSRVVGSGFVVDKPSQVQGVAPTLQRIKNLTAVYTMNSEEGASSGTYSISNATATSQDAYVDVGNVPFIAA